MPQPQSRQHDAARARHAARILRLGLAAVALWIAGVLLQLWPAQTSWFQHLAYGIFHYFAVYPAAGESGNGIAVVLIDERTDAWVKKQAEVSPRLPEEPFSRTEYAKLLHRLKAAGAERVVFDVFFGRRLDAQSDREFRDAIAAHGHVILGSKEVGLNRQDELTELKVVLPDETFLEVAESTGLMNAPRADSDNMVRRFGDEDDDHYSLAAAAFLRKRSSPEDPIQLPEPGALFFYPDYENGKSSRLLVVEFSDILEGRFPAESLKGRTVFVGLSHATVPSGRPDTVATPRGEKTPGVVWHAMAYANLLDGTWRHPYPWGAGILFALVVPLAWFWTALRWHKRTMIVALVGGAALAVLALAIGWSFFWPYIVPWPALALAHGATLVVAWIIGPVTVVIAPGAKLIFLSLVSAEYGSYKVESPEYKDFKGTFRQEGDKLGWAKFDDQGALAQTGTRTALHFDNCLKRNYFGVIHLIGNQPGSKAADEELEALRLRYPKFGRDSLGRKIHGLYGALDDATKPTYAQLEAYLAMHHGKYLLLVRQKNPTPHTGDAKEDCQSQTAHIVRLKENHRRIWELEFNSPKDLLHRILTETDFIADVKGNPD